MYGYIASHNYGQTLVVSDGRVFDQHEQPGGSNYWQLVEEGVDIDAYTQEASKKWNADWTEVEEGEIADMLDDGEYFIGKVPPVNPLHQIEVATAESRDFYSVSQVASMADVTRRYVLDEIEAGRLEARKIGNQYVISGATFTTWMDNPKRGSRARK